tara:strand:+ start:973 stop:1992 length:1020 start_codon:yes stop_codon:yes gene_type:complete
MCDWAEPHVAGPACMEATDNRVSLVLIPDENCTEFGTGESGGSSTGGGGGSAGYGTEEDPVITTIMYEDGTIVENPYSLENTNIVVNQNLIDNYPCVAKIVQEAYSVSSPLTGLVSDAFATNDGSNLNFTYSSTITPNGTTTEVSRYNARAKTCDIKITFNETYISKATELSIARTTLHESLHATLVFMFEEGVLQNDTGTPILGFESLVNEYILYLSAKPSNLGKAHHELMSDFVLDIASSLSSFGRSKGYDLPFSYYKAMSWGGLENTLSFKTLYPKYLDPLDAINNPDNINIDYLKIVNINAAEKDNITLTYTHPDGTTYTNTSQGNVLNANLPCN